MEEDSRRLTNLGSCVACLSSGWKSWARKSGYHLYRCLNCSGISVLPVPESVDHVYEEDYFSGAREGYGYGDYDKDKEAMKPTFVAWLSEIEEGLGTKGERRRIFDVGAATGYFLDIAKSKGWEVAGVELSPFASQAARDKGLDVAAGTLGGVDTTREKYDCVTMWDVLEHFRDPEVDVQKAHDMLRDEGLLVLITPDSGSLYSKLLGKLWHLVVPPEHLNLFTRKGAQVLLERNGFRVEKARSVGKDFALSYIFNIAGNWLHLGFIKSIGDKLRRTRLGSFKIPINLGDYMYVMARKKRREE